MRLGAISIEPRRDEASGEALGVTERRNRR